MDGQQFDSLTRLLTGSLPRRRLLQRAASVLGGATLAGFLGRTGVGAITCPGGRTECAGRCCDPDWECVGEEPDRICLAPCEGEASRCVKDCCAGVCCPQNQSQRCCPPGSSCCPGAGAGYECCPDDGGECLSVDGKNFCMVCLEGATRCGYANCCAPGWVCLDGPNPGEGTCIACPAGATKCGGKHCCTADETCSTDGVCVDACPAGRGRGVTAQAGCEPPPPPPCPSGTVKCGGTCVLECSPARVMNVDTCACECASQPCGPECCPDGQECTFSGNDDWPARCCLKGTSCGHLCSGDPRIRCCKPGPFGVAVACDAQTQVCSKRGGCRPKPKHKRRRKK